MTLKIKKTTHADETVLSLSGRIDAGYLSELQREISHTTNKVVLDLEEVNLVDRDAVRFLVLSERTGVELRSCPPYVREWMLREEDVGQA